MRRTDKNKNNLKTGKNTKNVNLFETSSWQN